MVQEEEGSVVLDEDDRSIDKQNFTKSHCDIIFGAETDLMELIRDIPADSSGTVSALLWLIFGQFCPIGVCCQLNSKYRPSRKKYSITFDNKQFVEKKHCSRKMLL